MKGELFGDLGPSSLSHVKAYVMHELLPLQNRIYKQIWYMHVEKCYASLIYVHLWLVLLTWGWACRCLEPAASDAGKSNVAHALE